MTEILAGVLPVLGVVVGSILTHLLGRSTNRESQLATLRQEAYADYLRAVSAVSVDRSRTSMGQLVDAKARMAIYGTDAVIDRLAEFERTDLRLSDPATMTAFVRLADQMRSENGTRVSKRDALAVVLFGMGAGGKA